MTKIVAYDSAEFLSTPASIKFYIEDALQSGDPRLIVHALGVVARAKSMANVARKSGLGRESLYKSLSENGRPEFATVMRVFKALDLELTVKSKKTKASKAARSKRTARKRVVKSVAA